MTGLEEPFNWSYVFGAVALTACISGPLLVIAWWTSDTRQRRKVLAKARRQLRHVQVRDFAEKVR